MKHLATLTFFEPFLMEFILFYAIKITFFLILTIGIVVKIWIKIIIKFHNNKNRKSNHDHNKNTKNQKQVHNEAAVMKLYLLNRHSK